MSDDAAQVPEPSVIDAIKAEFPNRRVKRVVMDDDGEELVFVLTSPIREEWKKYRREMTDAASDIEKMEGAIERAALAQIRWPLRPEVREIFENRPGIIQNFALEITKLAGAHAEVSAKNA